MRANIRNTIKELQRLSESHKLLVVMIGPPGSGKSTLLGLLRDEGLKFQVASLDAYVDELAAEKGLTYSEAFDKVDWKNANAKFKLLMKKAVETGEHLFIDKTNMGAKVRKPYFEVIRHKGYTAVALNMQISDAELKRRIKERADAAGKNIPAFVLGSMLKSYVAPTKAEGFDVIIEVMTEGHG